MNIRHISLAKLISGAVLVAALLFAAVGVDASVGLVYFDADPGPGAGQITVGWETETEYEATAFRVVRSAQPLVQTAATVRIVPAVGSGTTGGVYSIVDSGLTYGQRYYYWLYEITASGDQYLISQATTAVAPGQSTLTERIFLPIAFRSN